ncbi:sulfate permease family domain-containing protein [Ditylenchus destructor]|nr:sulfate permease family domain-containing protein [Ditylenchus destructor]
MRRYYQPCLSCKNFITTVMGFLPILNWLPTYDWKANLTSDIVGVKFIIKSKLTVYSKFIFRIDSRRNACASRHNSIGSFAVVSLMAGMAVDEIVSSIPLSSNSNATTPVDLSLPPGQFDERVKYSMMVSSTLALCVGLIQLAMGIFRLEIVTTYFSDQVVAGFTTAASCHVFVAQLKDLFGLRKLPRRFGAGNLFMKIFDIARNIPNANVVTVCISAASITFLILGKDILNPFLKRRFKLLIALPFELILVVLSTAFAAIFHAHSRYQINIVKELPTGLPTPIVPDYSLLPKLVPHALGIAVVVMAVHISLAKMFAKKMAYKVDPGQELFALGFSSSLSSFFPVYPVSCSLGRTMVNVEAGTKTQLSAAFSSILLCGIIVYMGQWLRTLPMCVLSAIIIVALKGMVKKFKDLVMLWPLAKIDFSIWLVSFVATVGWDVTEGLALSIVYALFTTVIRVQWPRWHFLANLSGTNDFRDAERYEQVTTHTGICIFRFDSPLLFTNVDRFKANIHKAFKQWQIERPHFLTPLDLKVSSFPEPEKAVDHLNGVITTQSQNATYIPYEKGTSGLLYRHFVIDCSGFTFVDYMGVNALKEIFTEMRNEKVLVYFAAAKAPVRDLFEKSGFYQYVQKNNFYPTIRDAVAIARKRRNASTLHLLEELSLPYDTLDDVLSAQPLN